VAPPPWVSPLSEKESFRVVEGDREGCKGVIEVIYAYQRSSGVLTEVISYGRIYPEKKRGARDGQLQFL